MVIYRGTDGKPGYHQTEDIHDAVSFVEQLRNDDGVEHARIFRLEEVAFEYRPYFRVELRAGDAALGAAPAQPAVAAGTSERPATPAETSTTSAPPPVAGSESAPPSPAPATSTPSPTPATSAPSAPAEPAPAATETATPPSPSTDTPAQESGSDSSSGGDNGVGARRGLFGR